MNGERNKSIKSGVIQGKISLLLSLKLYAYLDDYQSLITKCNCIEIGKDKIYLKICSTFFLSTIDIWLKRTDFFTNLIATLC